MDALWPDDFWALLGGAANAVALVLLPWGYLRLARPRWYRWAWHKWPWRWPSRSPVFTHTTADSFHLPSAVFGGACPDCNRPIEWFMESVTPGKYRLVWRCSVLDCTCRPFQRTPRHIPGPASPSAQPSRVP